MLHNLNEQFITEINDALKEGTPLPKCKKVDIVQRVAVSVQIFDHVCKRLLHSEVPTLPSEQVSAAVLQQALRYVEWAEDQKTIFLEVSVTSPLQSPGSRLIPHVAGVGVGGGFKCFSCFFIIH